MSWRIAYGKRLPPPHIHPQHQTRHGNVEVVKNGNIEIKDYTSRKRKRSPLTLI